MAACAPGEYLTFRIGDLDYGVPILAVREIRGYDAVKPLPDAPDYLPGVIDLRGALVPVIDLRVKLRVSAARVDAATVLIVLDLGERLVAAVADAVDAVVMLEAAQLHPPPDADIGIDTRHMAGIGAIGGRLIFLLDTGRLLRREEIARVDEHLAAGLADAVDH